MAKPVTDEIMQKFFKLTCDMEPENLTCDGELSRSQVEERKNEIRKQWRELQHEIGRSMTTEEVWNWYRAKYRR